MELLDKTEFDSLPANLQRKAICQDVIARQEINLIFPRSGAFFRNAFDFNKDITPQKEFNKRVCMVCAKGAIMCSWVGNFNSVGWGEVLQYSENMSHASSYPAELVKIFGREMLDNIEAAFETKAFSWHFDQEGKGQQYANAFRGYDMEDIMQHIVDNDGEFPLH